MFENDDPDRLAKSLAALKREGKDEMKLGMVGDKCILLHSNFFFRKQAIFLSSAECGDVCAI